MALISTALLALAIAPAAGLAASGDAAATDAYVGADHALVAHARAKLTVSEAALQTLLHRIRRECPKVAAGSPQDSDSEALTFELVGAMTLVAIRPNVQAIGAYSRAVAKLHWSSAKLTGAVRAYARQIHTQSLMRAPDMCADVHAWVASGYTTLPARTSSFNRAFYSVYVGIGLLPAQLLDPSAGPAQRSVIRSTQPLESQLVDAEARAVETWGHIMDALGLNP